MGSADGTMSVFAKRLKQGRSWSKKGLDKLIDVLVVLKDRLEIKPLQGRIESAVNRCYLNSFLIPFPVALPAALLPTRFAIFVGLPLLTAEMSPNSLASQYRNPRVLLIDMDFTSFIRINRINL
jgi:hypothetical protein